MGTVPCAIFSKVGAVQGPPPLNVPPHSQLHILTIFPERCAPCHGHHQLAQPHAAHANPDHNMVEAGLPAGRPLIMSGE